MGWTAPAIEAAGPERVAAGANAKAAGLSASGFTYCPVGPVSPRQAPKAG